MSPEPLRHAIGFLGCDPQKSSSSITNREVVEMEILGPWPRPSDLETLEKDPAICVLRSPPDDSYACSSLRTTVLGGSSHSRWIVCRITHSNLFRKSLVRLWLQQNKVHCPETMPWSVRLNHMELTFVGQIWLIRASSFSSETQRAAGCPSRAYNKKKAGQTGK